MNYHSSNKPTLNVHSNDVETLIKGMFTWSHACFTDYLSMLQNTSGSLSDAVCDIDKTSVEASTCTSLYNEAGQCMLARYICFLSLHSLHGGTFLMTI